MGIDYKQFTIQITTFGVNSSEVENLEKFKSELEAIYTTEYSDVQYPACGGSSELALGIKFGQFIAGAAASGATWDIIRYGLSKCWSSLKKLRENNESLALYLTIDFGDFELHISEAVSLSLPSLEELFIDIESNTLFLDSKGYTDITSITMPFIEIDDKTNRFIEKEPYVEFEDYWWKVEYQNGRAILYFNPKTHEVFIYS